MIRRLSLVILIFSSNVKSKHLKWGILATSRFAKSVMIETIQNSPRSVVMAISSRDSQKSKSVAQKFGIKKAYSSYDALINDPDIDVIYVNLPNSMHAEWTIKAARAGKHVLCEKPLALMAQEVDHIINAAYKTNVIVVEALQHLYHPQTTKIIELINSGKIGDLKLIKSTYSLTTRINKNNIRMHRQLGGGSLWDKGGYQVGLLQFIMKKLPQYVYANQLINNEMNVDILTNGAIKFENVLAQFDIGLQLPFRERVEIVGTKARLIIDDPWRPGRHGDPSSIVISDSIGPNEHIKFKPGNPYKYEIMAMESYVLDKKQPLISLKDSRNVALILEKLQKSAQTHTIQLIDGCS